MINAIIIEDERIIADEFKRLLAQHSPETEIAGTFSTVKDSIEYLSSNKPPDLIFSDVQLPDGLSFDIFNRTNVQSPVIFITAFDQFIVNAFEHNGIDYLLKPVDEAELGKAMNKYKSLEKHFTGYHSFINSFRHKTRSRLVVKKGIENISLRTDDIAIIYTEEKLVFVIDKEGKKYRIDKNLSELEDELDKTSFFRANRQYIVNIAFIKSYKTYEKVKLQVDLCMPSLNHQIVISQEMAPLFRRWISEL
ncbi:MAG: response regulator transcription factor [Chitinophagaceae bacterium]|nr:response regulator transcription factor [Chitinophagaceae bacterium]